MDNKGVSLMELLIVSFVIVPIVAMGMGALIVIEGNFSKSIQDMNTAARESRIAMDHIVRTLRFADANQPITATSGYLTANIKGGHLSYIPSDTTVTYHIDTETNTLQYIQDSNVSVNIARYITSFQPSWSNPDFDIILTVQKDKHILTTQTKVRALGDAG